MTARHPVVVAYVSGHGFGHVTRSAAVLERVAAVATVHVRTSGRALELARAAPWPATIVETDVGPGVAQRGPLEVDLAATREALARHLAAWPRLVEAEAATLAEQGADLVFADVPPIAFAAAARAGVPSVALANFPWSWIYDGYAAADPWFAGAARQLAAAEERATLALALAMGGGLEVFPRREEVAPIARPPTRPREEIRTRLSFAPDDPRPIVLASFGGFGGDLDLRAAARDGAFRLVVVSAQAPAADHVRAVAPSDEMPHQDLVAAADCVVSKPGYGTVAECLRRSTPLVHVPRGAFREYPALRAAIERYLPEALLEREELAAGRWTTAIRRALAARPRELAPLPDGAAAAAARIADLVSSPG